MTKILDDVELDIFRNLREYVPGAIIAGGAVRDMVYELPYTDVDIFFNASQWPVSAAHFYDYVIPKVFKLTREDYIKQSVDFYRELSFDRHEYLGSNVSNVVDIFKGGRHFQLISITKGNVIDHVKHNFDLNACKIYHDGTVITRTKEFKDFVASKELEASEAVKQGAIGDYNLVVRAVKIIERYKEFDIKMSDFLLKRKKEHDEKPPELEKPARKSKKLSQVLAEYAQTVPSINASSLEAYQQIYDNAVLASTPGQIPIPTQPTGITWTSAIGSIFADPVPPPPLFMEEVQEVPPVVLDDLE